MKYLKKYENIMKSVLPIINEGIHGRFEIYGDNNGNIIKIGYATTEEIADSLVNDFQEDFDKVWWEDTKK